MDRELTKQAMQLIRDIENGAETKQELNSQLIAALTALFKSISVCEEMDDDAFAELFGIDEPVESGVAAIKILAIHNAREAIDDIVDFVEWQISHSDHDDYLWDSIVEVLALFGSEGITSLLELAVLGSRSENVRSVLINAVFHWGKCHKVVPASVESLIAQGLNNASKNPVQVNTDLMMLVVELKLEGFGEVIERAFSLDRIDCGMAGDWEEVRHLLHVEGLNLPMPEKPFNSLDDCRRNAGMGVFSENIIFMLGEIQEEAAQEYLSNAMDAFRDSAEGQQLHSQGQRLGYVYNFLDCGLNYMHVTVDLMTVADALEILLELFPRKLSMDVKNCRSVINELCAFWHFVDRVHQLESAKEIETTIRSMLSTFRRKMSDTESFGMAKSIVMSAMAEGFDVSSQEDMQNFISLFNTRLLEQHEHASEDFNANASRNTPLKQRKKVLAKKKRK